MAGRGDLSTPEYAPMTLTRGKLWREGRDALAMGGIMTAALDARVLAMHLFGLDQTGLIMSEAMEVGEGDRRDYQALIDRRLDGEPVARILTRQEFYGRVFMLNPATLIPRPETELLVDIGLSHLRGRAAPEILDLGTGSGCIVLSLLAEIPDALGTGIDLSPDAVAQARENAISLGLASRFAAVEGHWYDPIEAQKFDLIVSNPPYIARAVIAGLERGVREFDPALALDGGEDGLDPYRIIVPGARERLVPGGLLAVEIGFDQGAAVAGLFEANGFVAEIAKDLAGHDRVVSGKVRESVAGG